MTIKINLQPKNIKAELGDYGVFTLRPMGVNEDLLLSQYAREIQEALTELDEVKKKLDANDATEQEQGEITKQLNEISQRISRDKERVVEVFKRLIFCEDEERHEKLFNEIPLNVLREKYDEVMQNG